MKFDSNVMKDVIRISVKVSFLVEMTQASHMRETGSGGRKSGNRISVSIEDEGVRKEIVKLSSEAVFEGSWLSKRDQDEILCFHSKLFVETIHRDRGHRPSQRVSRQEDPSSLFLLIFSIICHLFGLILPFTFSSVLCRSLLLHL